MASWTERSRRARTRFASIAILVGAGLWASALSTYGAAAGGAPRAATALGAGSASNARVIGSSNLGGAGLNGQVAVVGDTAVVAAGSLTAGGLHNHHYSPGPCPAVAVKVVDLTDPTNPVVASQIPVPAGIAASDVAVMNVSTPQFTGDLAAISLVTCGAGGGNSHRGVQYYDVSDPANPQHLGFYDADADMRVPDAPPCGPGASSSCASSQHSVSLVRTTGGTLLSLSTEPFASAFTNVAGNLVFPSGDLRIVDVTDPANPVQVGSWPRDMAAPQNAPEDQVPEGYNGNHKGFSHNGCRPFDATHSVAKGANGDVVVLPFYDFGMFQLDLSDPSAPQQVGALNPYGRDLREVEGNAGYGDVVDVGGRSLTLLAEEDWIAPDTRLRIDGPAGVAGEKFACEAMFTLFDTDEQAPIFNHDGSQIDAEVVYVGRGCPATATVAADPYLADPAGRIALVDRFRNDATQPGISAGSGCRTDARAARLQGDGAVGMVFLQNSPPTTGFGPEGFSPDGFSTAILAGFPEPIDIDIPVVMIDRPDAVALRDTLCPAIDGSGNCTGGQAVTGGLVDRQGDWGGLHIIDNTTGTPTKLSTYHSPGNDVFPPPDLGVYSIHHAIADGERAYVAAHSDGLRVLDLSDPANPVEVAHFVPEDMADPSFSNLPAKALVTGVARHGHRVVVTDVHSGLYVLEVVTPHARSIAMDLSRHLEASGRVTVDDGFNACRRGVEVAIQRRADGTWRTVGTDTTNRRGRFSVDVRDRAGRYRAVAAPAEKIAGDVHRCGRAVSERSRHRHD